MTKIDFKALAANAAKNAKKAKDLVEGQVFSKQEAGRNSSVGTKEEKSINDNATLSYPLTSSRLSQSSSEDFNKRQTGVVSFNKPNKNTDEDVEKKEAFTPFYQTLSGEDKSLSKKESKNTLFLTKEEEQEHFKELSLLFNQKKTLAIGYKQKQVNELTFSAKKQYEELFGGLEEVLPSSFESAGDLDRLLSAQITTLNLPMSIKSGIVTFDSVEKFSELKSAKEEYLYYVLQNNPLTMSEEEAKYFISQIDDERLLSVEKLVSAQTLQTLKISYSIQKKMAAFGELEYTDFIHLLKQRLEKDIDKKQEKFNFEKHKKTCLLLKVPERVALFHKYDKVIVKDKKEKSVENVLQKLLNNTHSNDSELNLSLTEFIMFQKLHLVSQIYPIMQNTAIEVLIKEYLSWSYKKYNLIYLNNSLILFFMGYLLKNPSSELFSNFHNKTKDFDCLLDGNEAIVKFVDFCILSGVFSLTRSAFKKIYVLNNSGEHCLEHYYLFSDLIASKQDIQKIAFTQEGNLSMKNSFLFKSSKNSCLYLN